MRHARRRSVAGWIDTACGGGLGVQQYKAHEPSREAIELAYEAILGQDMKARQKYGFRPPSTGRKTDLQGDEQACRCHYCPPPTHPTFWWRGRFFQSTRPSIRFAQSGTEAVDV